MKATRGPHNEFGLEVSLFCARHGITKRTLAQEAGVPYASLLAAETGRRAGHVTKAAVRPVMARYEAAAGKKGRGA